MPILPSERPRSTVCLLLPLSARTEWQPIPRSFPDRLRILFRRSLDLLAWACRLRVRPHYSTWQDHLNTNRGDSAIRLATRSLLQAAFDNGIEFIEIAWDELPKVDPVQLSLEASLFVIGGGGYYHLETDGALNSRIARDMEFLRQLQCPAITFASGVNRIIPKEGDSEAFLSTDAAALLKKFLPLLVLSSVRDKSSRELFNQVVSGHTVCIVDPALFLSAEKPHDFVGRRDGDLPWVGLNLAFHGPNSSRSMPDCLRLIVAAARAMAKRRPCRFFYFVHYEAERLIPRLLRLEGVPVKVVDTGPAEMLAWYSQLDIHICQMMHSSILSLNAGIPTINLSYDTKNIAFYELMGLNEYCLPAATTDFAQLDRTVMRLLRNRASVAAHIAARKSELRQDLHRYLADVVRLIRD